MEGDGGEGWLQVDYHPLRPPTQSPCLFLLLALPFVCEARSLSASLWWWAKSCSCHPKSGLALELSSLRLEVDNHTPPLSHNQGRSYHRLGMILTRLSPYRLGSLRLEGSPLS
jgi:hypothetical protein